MVDGFLGPARVFEEVGVVVVNFSVARYSRETRSETRRIKYYIERFKKIH
jgi:hypothetical protein